MLKPGLVAKGVLRAGEVGTADADAHIAHAIARSARECAGEECLADGRCHLHEVIAGAIGNGIAEAVHLLIGRGWQEHDVLGKGRSRALAFLVFHLHLAVGSRRIDAYTLGMSRNKD